MIAMPQQRSENKLRKVIHGLYLVILVYQIADGKSDFKHKTELFLNNIKIRVPTDFQKTTILLLYLYWRTTAPFCEELELLWGCKSLFCTLKHAFRNYGNLSKNGDIMSSLSTHRQSLNLSYFYSAEIGIRARQ